jgi:hypothetical protein
MALPQDQPLPPKPKRRQTDTSRTVQIRLTQPADLAVRESIMEGLIAQAVKRKNGLA